MQVKGSGVSGQIRELLSIEIDVLGSLRSLQPSSVHVRIDIRMSVCPITQAV
jgi:hypothetical protein